MDSSRTNDSARSSPPDTARTDSSFLSSTDAKTIKTIMNDNWTDPDSLFDPVKKREEKEQRKIEELLSRLDDFSITGSITEDNNDEKSVISDSTAYRPTLFRRNSAPSRINRLSSIIGSPRPTSAPPQLASTQSQSISLRSLTSGDGDDSYAYYDDDDDFSVFDIEGKDLFNPLKTIGQPDTRIIRGVAVKYKNGEYHLFPKTAEKGSKNITFKKRESKDCNCYTFRQGTDEAKYAKYFLRFFFTNYYSRLISIINNNDFIQYTSDRISNNKVTDYNSIDDYLFIYLRDREPVTKYDYVMVLIYFHIKLFFYKNYNDDTINDSVTETILPQYLPKICWKKAIIDIASIFNSSQFFNEDKLIGQFKQVIIKHCSNVRPDQELTKLTIIIIRIYLNHLDELVITGKPEEAKLVLESTIPPESLQAVETQLKEVAKEPTGVVIEDLQDVDEKLKEAFDIMLENRKKHAAEILENMKKIKEKEEQMKKEEAARAATATEKEDALREEKDRRVIRNELGKEFLSEIESTIGLLNGKITSKFGKYDETIEKLKEELKKRDLFYRDDKARPELQDYFTLNTIALMNVEKFDKLKEFVFKKETDEEVPDGYRLRAYVVYNIAINFKVGEKSSLQQKFLGIIESFLDDVLESKLNNHEYYQEIMKEVKRFIDPIVIDNFIEFYTKYFKQIISSIYSDLYFSYSFGLRNEPPDSNSLVERYIRDYVPSSIIKNIETQLTSIAREYLTKSTSGGSRVGFAPHPNLQHLQKPKSLFSTRKAREVPTTLLKKRLSYKKNKRVTFKNI